MAPQPTVHAPLVMERILPGLADTHLLDQTTQIIDSARALPAPWQRLVSADFANMEGHLIYERFVGVTVRDLSVAMRTTGRVLPLDALRSIIESICDGLAPLPTGPHTLHLSEQSIGLGIDSRWRFAHGALNHWFINVLTAHMATELEYALSADTVFMMSPEAIQGRPETPASLVSRAALFAWQLCTGGLHPYRGGHHEMMPSLTRYTRDEVRVPLTAHPELPTAVADVLARGISFSKNRFADLPSFRAALDAAWTQPTATPARTLDVIASLTWPTLQKQLQALKREPMLPIRWDGVWSGARTPEQGIAVLEDQLLERLEPLDRFPKRDPAAEPIERPPMEPHVPEVFVPYAPPLPTPRPGFFRRLLALFR